MKKAQIIIVYLFLFGMLLSVVQYLPLLEEESPTHRTELCKKAKESDSSGDDDDCEDDHDQDSKTDLFLAPFFSHTFYSGSHINFHYGDLLYQSLASKVNTPPPKA